MTLKCRRTLALTAILLAAPAALLISVHGANGLFGVLAVGIFADGTYGAGTNGVAGNVTGLLTRGHRVAAEVEDAGLDMPEMGLPAYPVSESSHLIQSPAATLRSATR